MLVERQTQDSLIARTIPRLNIGVAGRPHLATVCSVSGVIERLPIVWGVCRLVFGCLVLGSGEELAG
jgi:hypothetical protein